MPMMLVFQSPHGNRSQPVEADSAAARIFQRGGWNVIEEVGEENLLVDPRPPTIPVEPLQDDPEAAIGEDVWALLHEAGYEDAYDVMAASDADLLAIKGIGKGTLARLRAAYGTSEEEFGLPEGEDEQADEE